MSGQVGTMRSPSSRTQGRTVAITVVGRPAASRARMWRTVGTAEFGVPDVVVYNAARIQTDEVGDLTARQHLDAWAVNVVGAITVAARVLPPMADRGSGTFIVTGGMPRPDPRYVSLSLGKAGI